MEQAYSLLLAEYGLAKIPEPYPNIPGSVTGRVVETSGKTRLRRIHSPSGINRLPLSSELTFSDGMTIIYGGNGVGKSGFARILSNACFSRQQHPIYADIFDDSASPTPSACIEIEDEKGVTITLKFDSVIEHALLKRGFVVFDSAVAERHLKDTGPLGFTPTGFDIFAEIARAYTVLQSMLTADIERRNRVNTFQLAFIGAKTAASDMASELGRLTDLDKLRTLASFGANERARIEQLQTLGDQLRANSPDGILRRLIEARPQLLLIKDKLASARGALSEDNLAADAGLRADFVIATTAVAQLGADHFGHPRLQSVGSPKWEELVTASQAFVAQQHIHYPGDGDVCILCHQPLDKRAVALFSAYREFATGEGPVTLAATDAKLAARRTQLLALQLALVTDGSIAHSFLKESYPTVLVAIEETVFALANLRDSAIAALDGKATAASLAIADTDSTMDEVIALIDHDIALLRQSDVPASLKTIEDERAELRHREVLFQNLDQMTLFVQDARWIAKAESDVRRELNPRHLTEKESRRFSPL